MTAPIITFFNNKGGVGTTSLVYNAAWMLADLGNRVLMVDLDPQADLTGAAVPEERLDELLRDPDARGTIAGWAPRGDTENTIEPAMIAPNLWLIPGDLRLSLFESTLAEAWSDAIAGHQATRDRAVTTSATFWSMAQRAGATVQADCILFDVGPSLGAITRAAMVATDFLVVPVLVDLFSIQALRNLGPRLRLWRSEWRQRLGAGDHASSPPGRMEPIGYVVHLRELAPGMPGWSFTRLSNRIPAEYREHVLALPSVEGAPDGLAYIRQYTSLTALAREARKPVFKLTPADGAIGAHLNVVDRARDQYRTFVNLLIERSRSAP